MVAERKSPAGQFNPEGCGGATDFRPPKPAEVKPVAVPASLRAHEETRQRVPQRDASSRRPFRAAALHHRSARSFGGDVRSLRRLPREPTATVLLTEVRRLT